MVYIFLFIISIISIYFLSFVGKKTKIPAVLLLLFVGILFGPFGIYDFFTKIDSINTNSSEMSVLATYAVVVLFLVSGLGMNIEAIKTSGKKTLGLSIFPVIIEGLIMGVCTYIIMMILPIEDFHFGILSFMMIMSVFAMSAPAIIIPINMKAKAIGKKEKIFDEMNIASIIDNFTPFPLLMLYIVLDLSAANGGDIGFTFIILSLLKAILGLVIAYIVGHLVGYIISKLLNVDMINDIAISILLIIFTIITVNLLGPIGVSFGILTGLGVGVGFNIGAKDSTKKIKINVFSNKIYFYLFMPLIFIFVGVQIRVDMLLQPILILSLILVTILAIFIKGLVSSKYLLKMKSSQKEAQLSKHLFAAKGIILINISLVIGDAYQNAGLGNVLQFMYILAAVSILISVPYSIMKSEKIVKDM